TRPPRRHAFGFHGGDVPGEATRRTRMSVHVPGPSVSRREFLTHTVKTAAWASAPAVVPGSVLGQRTGAVPPSDRIVVGGIGMGARGSYVLQSFLARADVRFAAVCDVRNDRREVVKREVDRRYGTRDCAMYADYRELLARADIDAVLIATGDRWHALLSILAAQAGKDVYCEKPCSMTIAESQALAETFRRYGRIYQAGTQRRNAGNFVLAVELARSGRLGKLRRLHAQLIEARYMPPIPSHDWLPGEPEPPRQLLDWNLWLGPCPWRPYNRLYVEGGWRNYFDFHGGSILEWGTHTADLCQWANDADDTQPVEYEPEGSNQGPFAVRCRYLNGVELVMRDSGWMGLGSCSVRFEGDEAWVETGDTSKMEGAETIREFLRPVTDYQAAMANHVRDFIECVKTRSQPRANAAVAANSHIVCHAAYIAFQLGRKLVWDPARAEFVGDEEANRMRSRAMREPWRI
ncbi:MAG: Gfo/Idh/MocA family oxidoreductase, partial [Bryobacterales bacterium]|nr:Gfo/Idh/MocA family oxidoreductase [Bryobacteraceae bacterium]MDW8131907.1 Gfo/Idh/MocA family oxidoreductase [Bryobacterales bacterium]